MAENRGKKFEAKFKEDWHRTLPDTFLYRLQDSMGGFSGIVNICDFIAYTNSKLFLIECKAHQGNTWPITNFRQYEDLLSANQFKGVYPGVLLWFVDHNKVVWIPITEIETMMNDGKKSVNIKMLKDNLYNIYEIPSKQKRVYLDSDYNIFNTFNYK